jgi:hypothetical protein
LTYRSATASPSSLAQRAVDCAPIHRPHVLLPVTGSPHEWPSKRLLRYRSVIDSQCQRIGQDPPDISRNGRFRLFLRQRSATMTDPSTNRYSASHAIRRCADFS